MRPQLVSHPNPGAMTSLRARTVIRNVTVRSSPGQWPQPGPVGAHGVSQHERVEPIVLVARRAVATAQALQPVRRDDEHGQGRGQQRVDDRPVRTLDTDLDHAGAAQAVGQPPQTGRRVLDPEPLQLDALGVSTTDTA